MVEFNLLFLDCEEEVLSRLDQDNIDIIFRFEVVDRAILDNL